MFDATSNVRYWVRLECQPTPNRPVALDSSELYESESDWSGPIITETQQAGGREDIARDEVIRRYVELRNLSEEPLRELMDAGYAGQDYLVENYAFLKSVSEDRPAFPDFAVATYAHTIVDAIYESARTGAPVDVSHA